MTLEELTEKFMTLRADLNAANLAIDAIAASGTPQQHEALMEVWKTMRAMNQQALAQVDRSPANLRATHQALELRETRLQNAPAVLRMARSA